MSKPAKKPVAAGVMERDLIRGLPFVRDSKAGFHFWTVTRTGDTELDFCLGEALAVRALQTMERIGSYNILRFIIKAMVDSGEYGRVEVGFVAGIGDALERQAAGRRLLT